MKFVVGTELKVGETIRVWWSPNRDTITALRPYTGPLLAVLGEGTRLASFRINRTGMTIEPTAMFDVFEEEDKDNG